MTDRLSKERRSRLMSRVRRKDTTPEKYLRSLLHQLGFRFRNNVKSLPGSPDIVLPKYKTAIFVHGCFWHQHPNCRKARRPTSNIEFWNEKFCKNIARDSNKIEELRKLGWRVLVVWQCQMKNERALTDRLKTFLSKSKLDIN